MPTLEQQKSIEGVRYAHELRKPGVYGVSLYTHYKVEPGGTGGWRFKKVGKYGPTGEFSFGSGRAVSEEIAEQIAQRFRDQLALGVDIFADRREQRRLAKTFGECGDVVLEIAIKDSKSAIHCRQWRHSIEVQAKPLRQKAISSLGVSDIERLLKPLWEQTPAAAEKLRHRIERTFSYAIAKGYCAGPNPASKGMLKDILGKRKRLTRGHHASMPYKQVPDFMEKLRRASGLGVPALEFVILTGTRTSETLNARWAEINLNERLWVVPSERMKGGKEHLVPLSEAALAVLNSLPRGDPGDFVFPSAKDGTALSNMTLAGTLKRMGTDVTTHGFRASLRQWAGSRNFPREICEETLAHAVGNAVERAYKREAYVEQRRALLDAWAAFLGDQGDTGGKVVELRRA
jgi:integrase